MALSDTATPDASPPAEAKPQNSDQAGGSPHASAALWDDHAILAKVIEDARRDRALLRKLAYALAPLNPQHEVIDAEPILKTQTQAKSIIELEQTLGLERAVDRIWSEAVERLRGPEDTPPVAGDTPQIAIDKQDLSDETSKVADQTATAQPAPAPAEPVPISSIPADPPTPVAKDLDAEYLAAQPSTERDPDIDAVDASFEPPRSRGVVVTLSDQQPQPERQDVVQLERIPAWLEPSVRLALHRVEYAPIPAPAPRQQSTIRQFIQLVAASALGVALYVGVSGWISHSQHTVGAASAPPPQAAANLPAAAGPGLASNQAPTSVAGAAPEPQPILPFPMPRSYGVYAGVPGQLFELEQLPIKVPDPRVLVSAEIKKPGSVTTPGENLSFVVFRRDLVSSAPQTVTVRVVASVQRTTKFVDGKPAIVPLEGVWRIRAKSYEFKVSPLEGRPEMVVIQPNPGFVFPPGRYALVLNGFGYDFTVVGKATAPEQCLEQVEVVNGAVLSECPKT